MRVFIYYNLHRKCLSIKALEGMNKGRVVAHAEAVTLTDALFKVSESGRQRVLREKRKNVHAGVVGELYRAQGLRPVNGRLDVLLLASLTDTDKLLIHGNCTGITYNPYKYSSFVVRSTEAPVASATVVLVDGRSISAAGIH